MQGQPPFMTITQTNCIKSTAFICQRNSQQFAASYTTHEISFSRIESIKHKDCKTFPLVAGVFGF